MSLRMTKAEREEFLAGLHVGIISIAEPGRGPLTVPIWYGYEPGGELWIVTEGDSRKGRLLKQVERFSLCAQVMQARCSQGVFSSWSFSVCFFRLPRCAAYHLFSVVTVGCKYPVESSQVNSWLGD